MWRKRRGVNEHWDKGLEKATPSVKRGRVATNKRRRDVSIVHMQILARSSQAHKPSYKIYHVIDWPFAWSEVDEMIYARGLRSF